MLGHGRIGDKFISYLLQSEEQWKDDGMNLVIIFAFMHID